MTILYVDMLPPRYTDQFKNFTKKLPHQARLYFQNMFPIVHWLPKYNWIWFFGDLTAAITVGTLVIPQSLAYAKIANLPAVYGLYTSFIGVVVYPLFGTSKDISIVGQIVTKFVNTPQYLSGEWTMSDVATLLALFSGFITLAIGLLRLGSLFHFICQPAVAGFMAGSGLTIIINQFSKIFGITGINTSEAPYLVFGKTLANLNRTTVNAAFGLTSLVYLYTIKYLSQYLMRRYPQQARLIFFFNTSRSIIVLVFSTLICFMIHRFGQFETSPFQIIGNVPAGFGQIGPPTIKMDLVGYLGTDLIGIVVLLVMEHGAISSSLGKISDYKVDMSQEVFTLGLANIFGSFFGAYPGTGAFSRTAVMSKSGTRTPLTSFFVGAIVILCIYVFTPAFTYIPNASLAAIIAHAVSDLISGPSVWKKFWDLHPMELLVFASAYLISLFTRIDISVYVPVAISLVFQLYQTAQPKYAFLGSLTARAADDDGTYFPMDHPVLHPHLGPIDPSLICFQPQESIVFQNASFLFEKLTDQVKQTTGQGKPMAKKVGDRPWNSARSIAEDQRPLLRAIVLDLSGVHQMDYTGMECLMDTAVSIERYSGHRVRWYIIPGYSPAVRKCLLFAGFGTQRRDARLPGKFLSDLSATYSSAESQNSSQKQDGKGFEEAVIEQVDGSKQRFMSLKFLKSSERRASLAIQGHSSSSRPQDTTEVTWVQDAFPYLFSSVHLAVKSALAQKVLDEQEEVESETISVISDRDMGH
ncbi:hypothetical protein G6F16_002847 [Rhizopus arrhizus]|nr:hypothetical protein G6F21_008008 [Rhizopus arrhizus]KAG0809536.1 hypothetical protein G6F20_008701 [Rhizopus arrhizus]KAG0827287.1 hypothetical protein G6F19_008862 [Rhizopus arrhizus]KAG0828623.1 hypothetical protein G6F18_008995 [Rhizopus arrhizus]KAG0851565.1 hypothetical protein G6F17_008884 [Rhizopus arrhizus]